MIRRARELAHRPLAELPVGLAIAACGLVIVMGALILRQLGDPAPPRPAAQPQTTAANGGGSEVTNPPAPSWDYGDDGLAQAPEPAVARSNERARLRSAAHAFLIGYLLFTDGRGAAAEITGATRGLVARLEQNPPRESPDARRRRARVGTIRLENLDTDRATAAALIDDTITRYLLWLELVRTAAGEWRVDDVGPG